MPRSPISAFPPSQLVPLSNTFPTMIFSIVMCCCCCIPFTIHYYSLWGDRLVFEADSAVSSPIPRCHKFIQTHQSNCHNCCIDFALVHSLIGDYLCLFTRYIHIISMMTINDDTYNRHIRRIVTNYRQTSLQYYSTVPPKDYCVCVLCIVVYTSAYERPFCCIFYGVGWWCTTFQTRHI